MTRTKCMVGCDQLLTPGIADTVYRCAVFIDTLNDLYQA